MKRNRITGGNSIAIITRLLIIFGVIIIYCECLAETSDTGQVFTNDNVLAYEISYQILKHPSITDISSLKIKSQTTITYIRKFNYWALLAIPFGYLPISFAISVEYDLICSVSFRKNNKIFRITKIVDDVVFGAAPDPYKANIDLYYEALYIDARNNSSREMANLIHKWLLKIRNK
jgi:hypothetical protein